ncbi:ribosome maturation factor RimM [Salinicoccus sp. CNSTN-B1]
MRISIGRLVNFHGVKGEVKVLSDSDFSKERFSPGNIVEIDGKNFEIAQYRTHKNFHLLQFEGVSSLNDVEELKGKEVMQETDAVQLPLAENEFHYKDIIGLEAKIEDSLKSIGTVTDIFETGANDVWVVKGEREYMIPYIEDVVKKVDLEAGHIILHPMEGLLD